MTNCFGVQAQIRHATRTTTPPKGTVEAAARRGDTASGLPTPPCRLSVTPPVTHSACMRGDDGGGGSRSWASRRRGGLFELAACPDLPSTAEVAKRCYWNAVAQRPLLPRLHRSLRCRRRRGAGVRARRRGDRPERPQPGKPIGLFEKPIGVRSVVWASNEPLASASKAFPIGRPLARPGGPAVHRVFAQSWVVS
jgi:hypothetical protein